MDSSKKNSRMIATALICVMALVLILSIFTVMVYKNKRNTPDGSNSIYPSAVSSDSEAVSPSDQPVSSEEVSSEPEVSSEEPVTSDVSSEAVSSDVASSVTSDLEKNKNPYIINPDYKSEYYMVVHTGNQSIMVYKKDKNGGYTIRFMTMRCSTGAPATPTKEGVYRIEKKERWAQIGDDRYGQFGCLLSEEEGLYFSSTPYSGKKAWKLIEEEYDQLGQPFTQGGICLCTRDARWIYMNMPKGTQVSVVSQNGDDTKEMTKRKKASKYSGWDPTDKWSDGNPYFASTTTTTAAEQGTVG